MLGAGQEGGGEGAGSTVVRVLENMVLLQKPKIMDSWGRQDWGSHLVVLQVCYFVPIWTPSSRSQIQL